MNLQPIDHRKLLEILDEVHAKVKRSDMNVPGINRSILRMHIATIEASHPIKILGLLPRGSAAHVLDEGALDFLAEKKEGLSLLGLCEAEGNLSDRLGRPVGIVLVSGLTGNEAEVFPRIVETI